MYVHYALVRFQIMDRLKIEGNCRHPALQLYYLPRLQIVDEVRERREFLEEMQAAGNTSEHEGTIKMEIATRLKELERLGLDVKTSRLPRAVNPATFRLG